VAGLQRGLQQVERIGQLEHEGLEPAATLDLDIKYWGHGEPQTQADPDECVADDENPQDSAGGEQSAHHQQDLVSGLVHPGLPHFLLEPAHQVDIWHAHEQAARGARGRPQTRQWIENVA